MYLITSVVSEQFEDFIHILPGTCTVSILIQIDCTIILINPSMLNCKSSFYYQLQADITNKWFCNILFINKVMNLTSVVIEKLGKHVHKQNCSHNYFFHFINYNIIFVPVRYISTETKEVAMDIRYL